MTTAVATRPRARRLRDETVFMGCDLWMIVGLCSDGWGRAPDLDTRHVRMTPRAIGGAARG